MAKFSIMADATSLLMTAATAQTATSPASTQTLTKAAYTQNFDSLAATGTSQALPTGFRISESGTGAAVDARYVAGSGDATTGNVYSFGGTGQSDRALGSLASGGNGPIMIGAFFTNGLAATINALAIGYTGEQWRAGNSSDDGLRFQYAIGATSLAAGNWIDVGALDFAPLILSGNRALNGNLAVNQRQISALIDRVSIAAGQSFALRWTDLNSSGNDHGLGIDNLSLIVTTAGAAVPEASTWALMIVGVGASGAALRRRRRAIMA